MESATRTSAHRSANPSHQQPPSIEEVEQNISQLVQHIALGERKLHTDTLPQKPVFFLGNTGSGKSTFINYLAGCQLEKRDGQPYNKTNDVVVVKEASPLKECSKIGHSPNSETSFPTLVQQNHQAFYDCPGFLDNRGPYISLANTVNVLSALHKSPSARLVVMIDFNTLEADRADGLKKTASICRQFFARQELMTQHQASLLFCVTKIPTLAAGKNQRGLELLKQTLLSHRTGLRSEERQVIEHLANHLFIYDPEDNTESLVYAGGMKRAEILAKMESLPGIESPQTVFKVHLQDCEEKAIQDICSVIQTLIERSLESKDLGQAQKLIDLAQTLLKIEHPIVQTLLDRCLESVTRFYFEKRSAFNAQISSSKDVAASQQLFETIAEGIKAFERILPHTFHQSFDLPNLKKSYFTYRKKVEGLFKVDQIAARANKLSNRISQNATLISRIEKEHRRKNPQIQRIQVQSILLIRLIRGIQEVFQSLVYLKSQCLQVSNRYSHLEVTRPIQEIQQEMPKQYNQGIKVPIQMIDLFFKREKEEQEIAEKLAAEKEAEKQQKDDHARKLKELEKKIEDLQADIRAMGGTPQS